MLTDTSQTNRIKFLVNKTLSIARQNYPTDYEGGNKTFPESELLNRQEGQKLVQCCSEPAPPEPCVPGSITNFIITSSNPGGPVPPPYNGTYTLAIDMSWDPVPNVLSYSLTDNNAPGDSVIIYTPGQTVASMYYVPNPAGDNTVIVTLTALTSCGQTNALTVVAQPCFLAGSLVQIANNVVKAIEEVQVGDLVVGAFGEINTVIALHRPTLGTAIMCKINNEHSTTNHHPHVSVDKHFYCGNPSLLDNETYSREHKVIDNEGNEGIMMLHGLKKGRTQKLELGINLKTIEGSREVTALETYILPADTQLYNLVISGSHTYHVDGYAVTGWPREDDFDYDLWKPRV